MRANNVRCVLCIPEHLMHSRSSLLNRVNEWNDVHCARRKNNLCFGRKVLRRHKRILVSTLSEHSEASRARGQCIYFRNIKKSNKVISECNEAGEASELSLTLLFPLHKFLACGTAFSRHILSLLESTIR